VSTRVAVLGLGEAGSEIARDLVEAGADVRGYAPKGIAVDRVQARGSEAEAVADADLVLSVNSSHDAMTALENALPALVAGTLWADLNTASPGLKKALADRARERDVDDRHVPLLRPLGQGRLQARAGGVEVGPQGAGAQCGQRVLQRGHRVVRAVHAEHQVGVAHRLGLAAARPHALDGDPEGVVAADVGPRGDEVPGDRRSRLAEPEDGDARGHCSTGGVPCVWNVEMVCSPHA